VATASAGPYANLHLTPDRITMQAFHHSVFYRPDALPDAQPTASNAEGFIYYTSLGFTVLCYRLIPVQLQHIIPHCTACHKALSFST